MAHHGISVKAGGDRCIFPHNHPCLLAVRDIYPSQGSGSAVVRTGHRENLTPE